MGPDRPIRVLIIDDSRADREIYKRCLGLSAAWKFEFAEASSGAEGIEKCSTWKPDCILLDYNLPDQNGLEMLSGLRADSEHSPCAVVMLTAFGGEELAVQAMKAGVTDYLSKGRVAADTLPHTVVNAFEKWRLQWQIEAQRLEIQKSVRRYQVLLEAIPQMVWMATAEGSLEYANERWFDYTGLRLGEAGRLGWDGILHADDRERTYAAWKGAESSQGIFEIEHRLRRSSDGAYRWHLVRAAALRNPATGEIISWFGTCTEIEEQKRLESEKLERQKLESIGRLAGGLAHDFNNLLVTILGGASLAMQSLPPTHTAQSYLGGVIESGERAAQLTRRLLAYAGKSNLFVERVNVDEVVREVWGLVKGSLRKNVELEVRTETQRSCVDTDREQLRQAVMDLVTNAVEALGDTPGRITVRTAAIELNDHSSEAAGFRPAVTGGAYIVLEVSDTGCGMDENTQRKIFDPFFSTKSTGRGLSLAAVQGFVRSNRGGIQIDSAPGKGTRFRIALPETMAAARRSQGAGSVPQ